MPARPQNITARHDGYKASWANRAARPCFNRHRMRNSAIDAGGSGRSGWMILDKPIGVAGAGSIGCFVGGMYAAAGRRVALLARPRVIEEIEANGLQLTSFEGFDRRIASNQLTLSEDPSILGNTGVVLVTVKSADTAEIADVIAQHAPADAVIVSLQNGVGNVSLLRQRLPGRRVLAGIGPVHEIASREGGVYTPHPG